jgi:predicted nicotinamide N-methyase
MVAAKLGTFGKIRITDGDEDTVNLLDINLGKNKLGCEIGQQLLWDEEDEAEDVRSCLGSNNDGFDLVVAADVVYEDACVAPLLNTVLQLLKPTGKFLLAYTPRVVPFSRLEEEAKSRGLRCVDAAFKCHESFDNGELRKYKMLIYTLGAADGGSNETGKQADGGGS